MSDELGTERGMDVFDFLYELWREKWVFLGVVVLTLGIGSAIPLLSSQEPEEAIERVRMGVDFRLQDPDPLNRDQFELLHDLVRRLDTQFRFFLSDVSEAIAFKGPELRIFSPRKSITYLDYMKDMTMTAAFGHEKSGRIFVSARKSDMDILRVFREELERSSQDQVIATKQAVERELGGIRSAIKEVPQLTAQADAAKAGEWHDWAARRITLAESFLSNPALVSGELRFVRFLELPDRSVTEYTQTTSGRASRGLVTWALVGCMIGVIVVMFRIAIKRRRSVPAV